MYYTKGNVGGHIKCIHTYINEQRDELSRCLSADRITIAYSCHINWTIAIKFLLEIFCICEAYYSFGATEVNVFSCFRYKMIKKK